MKEQWLRVIGDCSEGIATPGRWTAVIPAAGRGTRLGHDLPKLLVPVGGRPVCKWMIDALEPHCESFVFVVAPDRRAQIEDVVRGILGDRATFAEQETPKGMGDAVLRAEPFVRSEFIVVAWGDQVGISGETVTACMRWHENRPSAVLTLPTLMVADPYIDVERDELGRIVRVRQRREGEIERVVGESDCGLFCFSTKRLFSELAAAKHRSDAVGHETGELNLLQVIPSFETHSGAVGTVRIDDLSQTIGINTVEDLALAEATLRRRRHRN